MNKQMNTLYIFIDICLKMCHVQTNKIQIDMLCPSNYNTTTELSFYTFLNNWLIVRASLFGVGLCLKMITRFWLLYPYCWHFYLLCLFVMFNHRCQYNGMWCDCHTSERFASYNYQSTIFYMRKCLTKSGICQLLSIRFFSSFD